MKSNFIPTFLFSLLVLICPAAFAQWSDTKNQFADSVHMPVCQAADAQQNSILIRSYPDSGYFVIWQDSRNYATNRTDIYAQKYDKNGNALWAVNGVPIASGANDQHYIYAANVNYRNYSIAATDSAGGFYFTYIDDSVNNTTWRRIMAQNILGDGSPLIPGQGFVVAQTPSGENYDFSIPQLIADDHGGFYLSYIKIVLGGNELYAHNYKKQNGTLVNNGGGWLNEYGRESQSLGPCGIINTVTKYSTTVSDYFIWPDGQGGCNVVMNIGLVGDTDVIGFNRLVRVKKDCKTVVYRRTTDIADCDPYYSDYNKDDVVVLHKYRMFSNTVTCGTPGPPPVIYTQTSFYIENGGLGFLILASGGHDYYYVKGATLSTPGNINADVIAFNQRNLVNFSVTPIVTRAVSRAIEKYDSLPYELCSNDFCYTALRTSPEGKALNRLDNINDTIMGKGALNFYDFSIAGSADKFYATAKLWPAITSERAVYLQQLKLVQASADSFSLHYNTPSKSGVVIGQEISTGFGSNSISYDDPMIATDNLGNGVFFIRDYYRHTRVSPIINGYELAWGAMGKPTGTGILNGFPYRPEFPYVLMDPSNGTGLITWQDERTPPSTFFNIYMRHLDSLNVAGHFPPIKTVAQLSAGGIFGTPAALLGTSKKYSAIEGYNSTTGRFSPVAELLDNYNLGIVEVVTYSHTGAIRMHNGKPYLNRNFTIKVQNNPAGAATINLRLYFTTAEFDALQTADPSITNPGLLAVVKQGNNTTAVPSTYTPIAGEEIVVPKSWSAVPGGYYIEIEVTSFSNFFVFKNENALPVTWVNVYAQWHSTSQAKVSWQIADEVNVEKYVVQHSKDGSSFTDVCTVTATNSTLYNCLVPGNSNATNYYRVKEVDKDGFNSYSKIVLLTGSPADNLFTLFPNPANKVLNIQTTIDIRQMTVIDAQGRSLYIYRGQNRTTTIDVTRYAKGIYTLMIIDNKGMRHYTKFMVE